MSRPDLLIDSYRSNQRIANSKAGHEEELEIRSLDRIASLLDDFIRIPILNIRIGLDPILGMLPWAGDTLTAIFSLYLIGSAIQYQLPKVVILRMAMNVAFDYLIGLIPFVGDASDFFIKSNRWNLNLFRQYARGRRRPSPSDYLFVIFVIGALIALIVGGLALLFYSLKTLSHWW
jgi:hypothetical protein